jgi:uncharacterized membrane protein
VLRRRWRTAPNVGQVSNLRPRSGPSLVVWVGVVIAASGGFCLVAGILTAFLVADHSSSDSSPSSLIAIGLGTLGVLAVILGVVILTGAAMARLWRRSRRGFLGLGCTIRPM